MTLKETLINHKIMWEYLSRNIISYEGVIHSLKEEYCIKNKYTLKFNCFLCEYYYSNCDICCLRIFDDYCTNDYSLYDRICSEKDKYKLSKLCYKMAHIFDDIIESNEIMDTFSLYENENNL